MDKLSISHHERVDGHPHRWQVHVDGRPEPVIVELAPEDRQQLELTDEEIHELLPTALQRRVSESHDIPWDTPVRLLQTHFIG
jgi:hypothetical protein